MRDDRVTIWTNPTTINADGTTNGTSIDLLADYTNAAVNHKLGTSPEYGFGVEVIGKSVVTGTGDGFTVVFKFQDSEDNTNWDDAGEFGTFTIDTNGAFLIPAGGSTVSELTRQKLSGRLRTARRYARVVAVAAGITGGESIVLNMWMSDGTVPLNDGVLR